MVLNQPVAKMIGFYMIGTSVIKELKQLLPEINSIIDTIIDTGTFWHIQKKSIRGSLKIMYLWRSGKLCKYKVPPVEKNIS